jgi:hypothetical protein
MTVQLPSDEKFTPRQRILLQTLHTTEWRRAPNGTLGPTLVALWNRGIIEGRLVDGFTTAIRYSDAYEWRLK